MHDNTRLHNAAVTRRFLQKNISLLLHPPMYPDLNPIEHLWDMMERRLKNHRRQPTTIADLDEALYQIWNKISQSDVKKMQYEIKNARGDTGKKVTTFLTLKKRKKNSTCTHIHIHMYILYIYTCTYTYIHEVSCWNYKKIKITLNYDISLNNRRR